MEITVIFGSNTGLRQATIEKAIALLSARAGTVIRSSSYYETEPWGFECKETFLNRVVIFETNCTPETFMQICLETEKQLGRIRHTGPRYQSRCIDIDILFCESEILNTPHLTVPHPRICQRNFVLVPLEEIMPGFRHPVTGKTIQQILAESSDTSDVKRCPKP